MAEAQKPRASRDGGVELFRCLLMFIIVLHHCCVHGPLRGYLYQRPEAWLELQCPWLPTVAILMMCAGFTFATGVCMDLARRGGMAAVRALWGRFRPAHG